MRFRKLKKNSKNTTDEPKVKYIYAPYTYRIKAFITDMFMIYAPILYVIAYLVMDGKEDFQAYLIVKGRRKLPDKNQCVRLFL